jgi:hypothetical protein
MRRLGCAGELLSATDEPDAERRVELRVLANEKHLLRAMTIAGRITSDTADEQESDIAQCSSVVGPAKAATSTILLNDKPTKTVTPPPV